MKPIFTLSESLVSFSIKWGNAIIAFWLVMMITKMCMKYVAYIVSDMVIVIAVNIVPTMPIDKFVHA